MTRFLRAHIDCSPRRAAASWQTIIAVTLVTILVWLFAEARSVQQTTQRVRLAFGDPTGQRIVRVIDPTWTGSVIVTLAGPSASISEAGAWADSARNVTPGAPGFPEDEGEQSVDMQRVLQNDPRLLELGLRVESVEPPLVRVGVEAVLPAPGIPVIADISGVALSGPPAIEPAQVQVRAPRHIIAKLQELEGGAHVRALLPPSARNTLQEGVQATITSILSLPFEVDPIDAAFVTIEPAQANITMRVRLRTSTYVVPSAPVWVRMQPNETDLWKVTIHPEDQLLTDITLTGPSDVIREIEEGGHPVMAVIMLTDVDLQTRVQSKPIHKWDVPEGVVVEGERPEIRITIEQRPAPADAGQ